MDTIQRLIPIEARKQWLKNAPDDCEINFRINVIEASGSDFNVPNCNFSNQELKQFRAAWDIYLYSASALGLFEGKEGNDLLSRLRSREYSQFRSAISECMVAWFFSGPLKFNLKKRPAGRQGKVLEYCLSKGNSIYYVEVKSPHREIPKVGTYEGDDSDLLKHSLKLANSQFEKGNQNILVIVPKLINSLRSNRRQLIHAFFGNQYLKVPRLPGSELALGTPSLEFNPGGHFINLFTKKGKPLRKPSYTRTSMVLTIEDFPGHWGIEHSILILHNPYALRPVSPLLWNQFTQFCVEGENGFWSDNKPVFDR